MATMVRAASQPIPAFDVPPVTHLQSIESGNSLLACLSAGIIDPSSRVCTMCHSSTGLRTIS